MGLRIILLSALQVLSRSSPIDPSDPIVFDCEGRCHAPHDSSCKNPNTCLNAPGPRGTGCCCAKPSDGKCLVNIKNDSCILSCCQIVNIGQQRVQPPICGSGCCSPGTHGEPHKCGRKLQGRGFCCVSGSNSEPKMQEQLGCCANDVGVNCLKDGRSPCCQWKYGPSTAHQQDAAASSADHVPCQIKNCSRFKPCPNPLEIGYQCSADDKKNAKHYCCLLRSYISVFDTCQRTEVDCRSRWRFCSDSLRDACWPFSYGKCCSSSWLCAHCWLFRFGGLLVILVILGLCFYVMWKRIRRCKQQSERMSGDEEDELHTMDEPGRFALLIGNGKYKDDLYQPLSRIKDDIDKVGKKLKGVGFPSANIIKVRNADKADFHALKKQTMQAMEGSIGAILFVFYGGHGHDGFFVSSDNELIDVHQYFQDFVDAHKSAVASAFSSEQAKQGRIIVVQDCCQDNAPGDESPSRLEGAVPRRGQAEICYIGAAGRGQKARDGHLTDALLDALDIPDLNLSELFNRIYEKCESSSCRRQRPWMYVHGGLAQIVLNKSCSRRPSDASTEAFEHPLALCSTETLLA